MKDLQSPNYLQSNLLQEFNTAELEKRDRLMKTIDKLNQKYGSGTINWAACGLQQSWRIRQEQLSSSSTTNISEIPIVYA